jgi:hypothetical protein
MRGRVTMVSGPTEKSPKMIEPKAEVAELLNSLPDTASYEDIQYHLYVIEKIRRGAERAESEGALSHEDAKKRLGRWLTN